MKRYSDLSLAPALKQALEVMKYDTPTEVQSKTIPLVMEGRDVLVTAETGTGKTAAFGVPLLQKVLKFIEENPGKPFRRALVVAPTRELAEQIGKVFRELTSFSRETRYCVIIGGSPYPKQLRELKQDPVFVIGTPGRLIDHIKKGVLNLDRFDHLVLDEADRMLDMGFAPQMDSIVQAMPKVRQTMMFSATLPPGVRDIVASYLNNPARVEIGTVNRPVDRIQQDVIELRESDKNDRLISEIDKVAGSIIVFTKTKIKADRVAKLLNTAGHEADSLHGDLTQGARRKVTNSFRDEKIRILVATDIAARGLDINHIEHVINFDVPMVEEDYIHRIGRTARAGREGHSIAFVTPSERIRWARILRLMGSDVSVNAPKNSKQVTRGENNMSDSSDAGSYGKKPNKNSSRPPRGSSERPSGPGPGGPRGAPRGAAKAVGGRPVGGRPVYDSSEGAAKGSRPSGKKDVYADDFHSEEARSIRAEFEARLAASERGLGYDDRKAKEVRNRGESPMRRIEGGARPGGKMPWKPERKPEQTGWSSRDSRGSDRDGGRADERGGEARPPRGQRGGSYGRDDNRDGNREANRGGDTRNSRGADRGESRGESRGGYRSEAPRGERPQRSSGGGEGRPQRDGARSSFGRDERPQRDGARSSFGRDERPQRAGGNEGRPQRPESRSASSSTRAPRDGEARPPRGGASRFNSESSYTTEGPKFSPRKGGSFGSVGRSGQTIGRKSTSASSGGGKAGPSRGGAPQSRGGSKGGAPKGRSGPRKSSR